MADPAETLDELEEGLKKSFKSAAEWADRNNCSYSQAAELLASQSQIAAQLIKIVELRQVTQKPRKIGQ